jgi:hypothetical protein
VIYLHKAQPVEAEYCWRKAERWLEQAGKRGGDVEKARQHVFDRRAAMWLAMDGDECVGAAVLTDDGPDLLIWLLGARRWRDVCGFLPEVDTLARALGCARVVLAGRKWWARRLASYGYAAEGINIVRRLS